MEEDSSSNSDLVITVNEIYQKREQIKTKITMVQELLSEDILEDFDTTDICESVQNMILDYSDESQLSELQCKARKLNMGSELCQDMCYLQQNLRSFSFINAVNEVLQVEKYETIAKKITAKNLSMKKEESSLLQEASNHIVQRLPAIATVEAEPVTNEQITEQDAPARCEEPLPGTTTPEQLDLQATAANVMDEDDEEEFSHSVNNIPRHDVRRINSLIRDQAKLALSPTPQMRLDLGATPSLVAARPSEILLPDPDISTAQRLSDVVISPTSQSVQNRKSTAEENLGVNISVSEATPVPIVHESSTSASVEETDSLINLTELPRAVEPRRRRELIVDEEISIRDYAQKAINKMNATVIRERNQVYEGPPTIIESLSVNCLMKTPGFRNSIRRADFENPFGRFYTKHAITERQADFEARRRLQNPNREMRAGEEEQTDEGAVPAYVVPMPVAPANLVPETLAALARPLPKTPETPEAPGLAEAIGIPDAVAMQPEMAAPEDVLIPLESEVSEMVQEKRFAARQSAVPIMLIDRPDDIVQQPCQEAALEKRVSEEIVEEPAVLPRIGVTSPPGEVPGTPTTDTLDLPVLTRTSKSPEVIIDQAPEASGSVQAELDAQPKRRRKRRSSSPMEQSTTHVVVAQIHAEPLPEVTNEVQSIPTDAESIRVPPEATPVEDLPDAMQVPPELQHLVGTPVANIFLPPTPPSPLPRIRPTSMEHEDEMEAEFFEYLRSTRCTPPSEQWKEFNFVEVKLHEMWIKAEKDSSKRSININNILVDAGDYSKENMLTLLRVLDKMSLQRKVLLRRVPNDVIVEPFEMPYVTAKQYSLRGKPPRF